MSSAGQSLMSFGICLILVVLSGCGKSGPSGSATEKLNTAPPLKPEVPEPVERKSPSEETDANTENTVEETALEIIEVPGMTFSAPNSWKQNDKPFVVDAEFEIPGAAGVVRLTIMKAGGTKEENIVRWKGQFRSEPGDEPAVSELEVDGKTASMVDIRGTFSDQRRGIASQDDYRMLAFIIPFSAADSYFIKATGPQATLAEQEETIIDFVKSGKLK